MVDSVRNRIQWFGFWVLMGMAVWPMAVTFGPRVEGRLFPVVSLATLTKVIDNRDGTSTVWGKAIKLRNCQYLGVDWYTGTDDDWVRVKLNILEPTKIRRPGWLTFGPWVVSLPPDEVRRESWAVVKHSCHQLWATETRFYIPAS